MSDNRQDPGSPADSDAMTEPIDTTALRAPSPPMPTSPEQPALPKTLTYPDADEARRKPSRNSTFRPRSYNPFLFAAGVEPSWILNRAERRRVVAQGALVWLIALIGGAAMVLFCSTVLDGFQRWFIGVGVVWGLIVFFIDSWITAHVDFGSMEPGESVRGKWPKLGMFIARFVLAVVIGVFIAEPIIMTVFNDRVEVKLEQIHSERVAALNTSVPLQFKERSDKIAAALAASEKAFGDARSQEEISRVAFEREANGTGGTGVPGEGPDTQREREAYAAAQRRTRDAADALSAAQATNRTDSEQLRLDIENAIAQRTKNITDSRDLLDREEALRKVLSEHGWLAFVRWYLTAVLVLIDLMPLLLKYASGRTLYMHVARLDAVASVYGTETRLRKQSELANAPLELALIKATGARAQQESANEQADKDRIAQAKAAEFEREAAVAAAKQSATLQRQATEATAADVKQGIEDRQGIDVSGLVAAHLEAANAELAARVSQRRAAAAGEPTSNRDHFAQPPPFRSPGKQGPAANAWHSADSGSERVATPNPEPLDDTDRVTPSNSGRPAVSGTGAGGSDEEFAGRVYQITEGTLIPDRNGINKWRLGKTIVSSKGSSTLFEATEIPDPDGRKTWEHDFVVKVYHMVANEGSQDDPLRAHRLRRALKEAADFMDGTANDVGPDNHIAQVFHAGTYGSDYVIVRKKYRQTLDQHLADLIANDALTLETTWIYAFQLLTGLRVAWKANNVHLDIKPTNVGVDQDEDGNVLLQIFDWESRKDGDGGNAFETQGGVSYSFFYSPYEQYGRTANWGGPYMYHADLRAWAAVWYEMITGTPPHLVEGLEDGAVKIDPSQSQPQTPDVDDLGAFLTLMRDTEPRHLSEFNGAKTPPELDQALARWLSHEPAQRNPYNKYNIDGFLGEIDKIMLDIRNALIARDGYYADQRVGRMTPYSVIVETENNQFRDVPPWPSDDDDDAQPPGPRPPSDLPRPPRPSGGHQAEAVRELPTQRTSKIQEPIAAAPLPPREAHTIDDLSTERGR